MDTEKVNTFIHNIIEESGWVTDNWIAQFAPSDFSDQEIEYAKVVLAKKGVLYEEGSGTLHAMTNNIDPPEEDKISTNEVLKNCPMKWTNVGFPNPDDIEDFKEMITEYDPYKSIVILDATGVKGPDGLWLDVKVYLGGLEGKYRRTIYNDTEGNWDCFWA